MAQAKIEIKIGGLTFTGDGDAAWLEKQLDKLLEFAKGADIGQTAMGADPEEGARTDKRSKKLETLSAFLKSHNSTSKQVQKFLATASWLTLRGTKRLTTGEITAAIAENHQGKLANPSQCLNENVKKGYCEKQGKQFYVTPEGFQQLGVEAP